MSKEMEIVLSASSHIINNLNVSEMSVSKQNALQKQQYSVKLLLFPVQTRFRFSVKNIYMLEYKLNNTVLCCRQAMFLAMQNNKVPTQLYFQQY